MKNLLCLHGLGCGGDTISLLNAEEPDLLTALEMLDINVAWHPSLSLEKGDDVKQICADFASGKRSLDLFIVEGAVPTGPDGSGRIYEFLDKPFLEWVRELAAVADEPDFREGQRRKLAPLACKLSALTAEKERREFD